ncbi:MAG: pilus assembly protein TadG-related protein [Paracoccaceae bacterium]|nr:pilus assembly protein TadG-related protein [Paracoccaceae bacterium]
MARRTDSLPTLRNSTRIFARDEEGSFVIFSLFIFTLMVLIGGIAIDVMRFENLRTTMQNTVDRAVLAAADRDQTVPAQAVVDDYLVKAGMPPGTYTVDVQETRAGDVVTSRRVTVSAETELRTYFMHMMGTPTLATPANSTAEEGINRLEISLVLDVSGSMGANNKLENLKDAAQDFVIDVLTDVDPGQVSINVVPYSAQVNAGTMLLDQFAHTNDHDNSHCVHFSGSDFNTTVMDPTDTLQQAGHFDPWTSYRRGTVEKMQNDGRSPSWVCRTESDFQITPWANSITAINNQIEGFTAGGNTSIDVAMKWGTALLDPSTRPVFNNLLASGDLSADFDPGRPYDHDPDDDVLKFVVVMTDGINTTQYYLRDSYRSGLSGIWKDPDTGRYSMPNEEINDRDNDGDWNEEWWYARNYGFNHGRHWIDDVYDSGTENAYELTWPQVWAEMSMSHRAYSHFYQQYYNANHYYDNFYRGSSAPRRSIGSGTKNNRLDAICDAAKDQDIIVFSVGFEVTDSSAAIMQNCASSANHFYRVEGLDISYAFESIANQINQLKLTQ